MRFARVTNRKKKIMAKEFAKKFYRSKAWKDCRKAYIKECAGLCEACLADGIIRAGEELHHKIPLTPDNINDAYVTLNFDNLIYLCHEHHMIAHDAKHVPRFTIDAYGKVTCK